MKSIKRLLAFLSIIVLCIGIGGMSVFAATTSDDGLEVSLSTDKEQYSQGEPIVVTLTVTNTNKFEVSNISLESMVPEGYSLPEGEERTRQIESLAAGDTAELVVTLIVGKLSPSEGGETGDSSKVILWVALFLSSVGMIFLLKRNGIKRMLAHLLCLSLAVTIIPMIDTSAYAAEDNLNSITITDTVLCDDEEITINAIVTYQLPDASDEDDDMVVSDYSEPAADAMYEILNPRDGVETEELAENNLNSPIRSVDVSYTLKDGSGAVFITESSQNSYFGRTPGALSVPVEFTVASDELEEATISFHYDRSKLNGIDENDLGICWYDEENDVVVLLDNTVVDTENQTVSVKTNHFSEYIVVAVTPWYKEWEQEQLVVRGDDEFSKTPYYNIVFVLDSSGSMSGDKNRLCQEATIEFINLLKGKDKISIVGFEDSAHVYLENQILEDISSEEISRIVGQVGAYGGTNYQDALNTALSLIVASRDEESNPSISDGISRQSLLIFLSDGEPTTYYTQNTLDQLEYLAEVGDCRCVTIGLGYAQETYLKEMASVGNGEYMYISDASQLLELFETINSWYVGSTKDSDGDRLPDIVETTGMRTQYGYFVTTDPSNPDTDGDGVSDGDEMGQFVYRENGKSYFKIQTDAITPTYYSEQSKIVATELRDLVGNKKITSFKNLSFDEIKNWFSYFRVIAAVRVVNIEVAPDLLSETVYKSTNVQMNFEISDSCITEATLSDTMSEWTSGNIHVSEVLFKCKKNLLKCKNEHSVNIGVKPTYTNCIYVDDELERETEDPRKKWKEVLSVKEASVYNSYVEAKTSMYNTSDVFVKKVQTAANSAKEEKKNSLESKIEKQLEIDSLLPDEAKEAFIAQYYDKIDSNMESKPTSYDNVKTAAQLVNKVGSEVVISNEHFEFTDSQKNKYRCDYTSITWLGSYAQGTITDLQTNRVYHFGGTSTNSEYVDQELEYLEKFAKEKFDEVYDAIFEDVTNLSMESLKDFVKALKGDRSFVYNLSKYATKIDEDIEKMDKTIQNFEKLKKMHDIVVKKLLNSEKMDVEDVAELVNDYNEAWNDWDEVQ